MHKVGELFCRLHHLHSTEVYTTQHNPWLPRRLDIGLQGRLSVQFDGEVDHAATLHQTVGGCVSPSASDIYSDRRTPPYYLVVGHTERWLLRFLIGKGTKSFSKEGKSFITIASEHRIVYASHQRNII